jgi:hypothetical protein
MRQLHPDPPRDDGLLAAGVDEQQVFWRLSKKRKLREGASAPLIRSIGGAAAPATRISCRNSGGATGAATP